MPYTLAVGDLVEARFYCNDAAQNGINVIHYNVTAVIGGSRTDQQVADALSTAAAGAYKPYLPSICSYAGLTLQVVDPVPQVRVRSVLGNGFGAQVADPLPPEVTLKIEARANVVGRRGRGRSFLPFWTEDDNNALGRPNAACQALAAAWVAIMYSPTTVAAGGNSATLTPVIWSKKFAPARNPVVSTLVPNVFTHMKRRSFANKSDTLGPPL